MQIAFIAACLLGTWVFWRRRRIDPMLLGFAGAMPFNLLYQPALFPKVASGLANNPWAQAYASGFPMVALFAAGYAIGLGILTMLFRTTHGAVQASVAVLAGWWGFYSHRNDLMIEIGIVKMVLYSAAAALFLGWVLARLTSPRVRGEVDPPERSAGGSGEGALPHAERFR